MIVKKGICAQLYLLFGRNPTYDIPTQLVTQGGAHLAHYGEETTNKQVTFRDPVSNSELDDPDLDGNQNDRETSANLSSANPPYATPADDPGSSYSPYHLPPVLEEPSSSFSEGKNDWLFGFNYQSKH